MESDLIAQELSYLLSLPASAADLLIGCDAQACVDNATMIRLLAAEPGEIGSKRDDFRDELAGILRGYPHAVELAQRSLDARDEYAHRAGRAA